jgi:hypothetical protein
MPKPVYQLLVGEQKLINAHLAGVETNWKPILMSAIPKDNVPNGVIFAVMVEQITD